MNFCLGYHLNVKWAMLHNKSRIKANKSITCIVEQMKMGIEARQIHSPPPTKSNQEQWGGRRRMSLQKLLQNLRTVKKCQLPNPSQNPKAKIADTIISAILITSTFQPIPATTTNLLSKLTSNFVHLILSDPRIQIPKCLDFFNFLVKNQALLSFQLSIETHLTLLCRLVKSRKFEDAEDLLRAFLIIHENGRCPFSAIASFFQNNCYKPFIRAKVFNLMIKVYSDNQEFNKAMQTFDYMRNNGVEINERTCTILLIEITRCDQLELGIEFFCGIVESGIEISVFSLTVVVDGLCKSGEIRRARELAEKMVGYGIRPNIITCNTLVDACAKRWNFDELDKTLELMRREGVEFSVETYKFLIDGFSSSGRVKDSERMVFEMLDKGFKMDVYTCNLIIAGYCRLDNVDRAFSFFRIMDKRGIGANADTYRILVCGFCKVGKIEVVQELVTQMNHKGFEIDPGTFNTLIDAYCKQGKVGEAFSFLKLMEEKGVIADFAVHEMVLSGLCESGRTEESKLLFSTLMKRGLASKGSRFVPLAESSTSQENQKQVHGDEEMEISPSSDLLRSVPLIEPSRNQEHQGLVSTDEEMQICSSSDLYSDLIAILRDGN